MMESWDIQRFGIPSLAFILEFSPSSAACRGHGRAGAILILGEDGRYPFVTTMECMDSYRRCLQVQ